MNSTALHHNWYKQGTAKLNNDFGAVVDFLTECQTQILKMLIEMDKNKIVSYESKHNITYKDYMNGNGYPKTKGDNLRVLNGKKGGKNEKPLEWILANTDLDSNSVAVKKGDRITAYKLYKALEEINMYLDTLKGAYKLKTTIAPRLASEKRASVPSTRNVACYQILKTKLQDINVNRKHVYLKPISGASLLNYYSLDFRLKFLNNEFDKLESANIGKRTIKNIDPDSQYYELRERGTKLRKTSPTVKKMFNEYTPIKMGNVLDFAAKSYKFQISDFKKDNKTRTVQSLIDTTANVMSYFYYQLALEMYGDKGTISSAINVMRKKLGDKTKKHDMSILIAQYSLVSNSIERDIKEKIKGKVKEVLEDVKNNDSHGNTTFADKFFRMSLDGDLNESNCLSEYNPAKIGYIFLRALSETGKTTKITTDTYQSQGNLIPRDERKAKEEKELSSKLTRAYNKHKAKM